MQPRGKTCEDAVRKALELDLEFSKALRDNTNEIIEALGFKVPTKKNGLENGNVLPEQEG